MARQSLNLAPSDEKTNASAAKIRRGITVSPIHAIQALDEDLAGRRVVVTGLFARLQDQVYDFDGWGLHQGTRARADSNKCSEANSLR
jgi:hypothetical protein